MKQSIKSLKLKSVSKQIYVSAFTQKCDRRFNVNICCQMATF